MTMIEDLRECPFCGNENDFEGSPFPNGRRASWIVRCGNPGCCAELIGDTAHEAVVRWNRRTHAEQIERDARDAERYRLARDADPDSGSPYIARERQDSWGNWKTEWLGSSEADQAIDTAMHKEGE